MVGLVEMMLKLHGDLPETADSLRPTTHGPDEDDIRIVEDTPKAKTPRVRGLPVAGNDGTPRPIPLRT